MPNDIPEPPEVKTEYERELWRELINRMLGHTQEDETTGE